MWGVTGSALKEVSEKHQGELVAVNLNGKVTYFKKPQVQFIQELFTKQLQPAATPLPISLDELETMVFAFDEHLKKTREMRTHSSDKIRQITYAHLTKYVNILSAHIPTVRKDRRNLGYTDADQIGNVINKLALIKAKIEEEFEKRTATAINPRTEAAIAWFATAFAALGENIQKTFNECSKPLPL